MINVLIGLIWFLTVAGAYAVGEHRAIRDHLDSLQKLTPVLTQTGGALIEIQNLLKEVTKNASSKS